MGQSIGSCIKKSCTGNVKDKDSTDGILEITGNETAISLLTGCVPELKPASGTIMGDIFAEEVDTDSGLNK
jgi:hypothetical protein